MTTLRKSSCLGYKCDNDVFRVYEDPSTQRLMIQCTLCNTVSREITPVEEVFQAEQKAREEVRSAKEELKVWRGECC